jgi:hypothetical protein
VSLVVLLMQAHSIMVDVAMTLSMSFRHSATSPVDPKNIFEACCAAETEFDKRVVGA